MIVTFRPSLSTTQIRNYLSRCDVDRRAVRLWLCDTGNEKMGEREDGWLPSTFALWRNNLVGFVIQDVFPSS